MILTDYRFLLDVHEINSQISLSFKQGDTGRLLYITLTENGDIFNIPQNCVAVFTALKPDGTIIFNDCEIIGNEIVYTHTAQTAAVAGKVDCELRLYGAGNTLLTSPHFTIFVHPTVYADQIESKDEVNTLTALISEANRKLANGDFVPKVSIGTVETLPAGRAASVSIAGTPEAPVFNFGIPQGEYGQGEASIPDTELSTESTRTVQNRVIAQALNEQKAALENHEDSKENPHDVSKKQLGLENVDNTSDKDKPISEAQAKALEDLDDAKVDKEEGKGLSSNDFTDEYKEKLDGIDDLDFTLDDGSVNTPHIANGAVTAEKIAAGATCRVYKATLTTAWAGDKPPFTQTVMIDGFPDSDRIFSGLELSDDVETAITERKEAFKIYKIRAEEGKITAFATEPTNVTLKLKFVVHHGSGLGTGGNGGSGEDEPGGGEPGEPGFSPIANVTQTADGAVITITDKAGTTTATISNGKDGASGERGNSILNVTTAPSSYSTATGGFTPTYRISLSSVLSQSKAAKVLVGDSLRYNYYIFPVGYVDTSYVYCGTRVSIQGATPVKGTDYYTAADKAEMVSAVIAALPDASGVSY